MQHTFTMQRIFPREVVIALIYDIPEIACPVLEKSPLINNNDILELIKITKNEAKFLSISKRRNLKDKTVKMLLIANKKVTSIPIAIIRNNNVNMSEEICSLIIRMFLDEQRVIDFLFKRYLHMEKRDINSLIDNLDPTVKKRLLSRYDMSDHNKNSLLSNITRTQKSAIDMIYKK